MTNVTPTTRLILLPGLGADGRLFEPQRAVLPNLQTPAWIAPRSDWTLADYARRLAERIDAHGSFVLGGASFGGMVSLEMARVLTPRAVLLIGSCRTRNAVAPTLRWMGPLAAWSPVWFLKAAQRCSPAIAPIFGDLSNAQKRLFVEMLKETSPTFMRWACRAIVRWRGVTDLSMPVHHVHGKRDRIIPAARVQADALIDGAGHLLSLTHPQQVNEFIAQRIGAPSHVVPSVGDR